VVLNLPPILKLANRVEVLLDGADPVLLAPLAQPSEPAVRCP
jgi:hypothetical protein